MILESRFWDARVLVTVHPSLGDLHAVLGAGLSIGRRKHDIYLPDGPLATYGVDQFTTTYLEGLRDEGRVEAVLGIGFDHRKARFTLAAQPYYVVAAGKVSTLSCSGCVEGLRVDSLEAD